MSILRFVLVLLLLVAAAAGGAYVVAGRGGAPAIHILQPEKFVGQESTLDVSIETPGGTLSMLTVALEQKSRTFPLYALGGASEAKLTQEAADRIRITRRFGKRSIPDLQPGPVRIVASAARMTLYGWRTIEGGASKDLQARFEPPRLAPVSTHHHVNHGGSEMIVYRVTPPDVRSGVRVGELTYPGHPASGADIAADPSLTVAFFALLQDQDLATPIELYAVDEAGNRATAPFEFQVFPRPFKKSRIELDDRFLGQVVPRILQGSPELKITAPSSEDLLPAFLKINGDLRQMNSERIAALAAKTAPRILWSGAFQQLGNSQVESSFADHRTYFYRGKEVDQQVHLGFDLAVTAAVPVVAANNGRVLYASDLGIYGNCVILDHGMGVQSLYAHLSSIDVAPGETVQKRQTLGRSGMTGLAGGDHLHFTMLIDGHPVNAVEWWDPHWIEDRIMRKLREAGAPRAAEVSR